MTSTVTDPRIQSSKRTRGPIEPVPPREIVGNAEVRKMCGGITRHTLIRWRTQPGFPKPIRTLTGTPKTELWDAREVRAWLQEKEKANA